MHGAHRRGYLLREGRAVLIGAVRFAPRFDDHVCRAIRRSEDGHRSTLRSLCGELGPLSVSECHWVAADERTSRTPKMHANPRPREICATAQGLIGLLLRARPQEAEPGRF